MDRYDSADTTRRAPTAPFRLDGCLVLPALNRVRRGEETVSVEPRVMMVLVRLAERPGEVLSREHLFATVWPDAVVCEEALTRTISELRRLFGDDPRAPRVIETIRKSGYRLVAPVTPAADPELRPAPAPGNGSPPRPGPPPLPMPEGSEPFRVGDWRVEPELARLTRGHDVVRLEPRVMQVLVHLAARPGEVVARTALLRAVWPQGEVHETTLTSAVSDLRRAFEDATDEPRYVETIRGVGYRLVAPVRRPSAGAEGVRRRRPRARLLVAAGLAAAVVAAVLVRMAWGPDRPASGWHVRQLTAYPGTEYSPALSPDGSMVVFSWQGESPSDETLLDLWIMHVENGAPVRLTAEAGHEIYPTWSPDGTTIAYASGVGDSFSICTIPVLGGGSRRLVGLASPVGGLDWSPDGKRLAYSAHAGSSTTFRIHLLDLATLESTLLDVPLLPGDDVSPAFSPNGTSLAFVREENYNHQRVLHTVLGSGVAEELTGVGQRIAGLDWTADRELVVSTGDLVDFDLWLADLDSDRRTWLEFLRRPGISPTTARGGSRLVYGELAYDCNIWSVAIGGDGALRPSEGPLIASTRLDYNPVCSPDGASIAFISDRSGNVEMWIADAGGGSPWQLTEETGSYLMNPCWSPDSRRLAYSARSGDRLGVFVSEVDTKVARRLSPADRNELVVHWSSSGEWLYHRAQRGDAWELWRRSPDGSREERVSDMGFTVLGEAAGADLLCRKDDDPGIWCLPAGGGEPRRVLSGDVAKDWTGVAAAETGLFFVRRGVTGSCLGFWDWQSMREDSLASVPLDSGMLVISPDGSRLLYDCTTEFEIDLMLADVAP